MPTIEDVETFWNNRPCNIKHSNAEFGTKKYFDEVEARKYFVEPHIPKFAEFEKWNGKRVLEIGSGIGTDSVNFVRAGADYTGVELSQTSLDITKKRFDVYGIKGTFYQGNAENLMDFLPLSHYDLIYSFGVIHHTPKPAHLLMNLWHYMDGNSELRFMVYAKNSWKNIMIEAGFDQPEAQKGCPIARTIGREELEMVLETTGYTDIEIEQDHIFPYVIEKYINYEYELQPWFKVMPYEMFVALEKSLGWHTLVKCKKGMLM